MVRRFRDKPEEVYHKLEERRSLNTMESIALFSLWIILCRLVHGGPQPSHSLLLNRCVALVARKFSRNRAARMRRFARYQLKCSKDFAALITDYSSFIKTGQKKNMTLRSQKTSEYLMK